MSNFINDPDFKKLWYYYIEYLEEVNGIILTKQEQDSRLINFELDWKGDLVSAKEALNLTIKRGEITLITPNGNNTI